MNIHKLGKSLPDQLGLAFPIMLALLAAAGYAWVSGREDGATVFIVVLALTLMVGASLYRTWRRERRS